jgi:hypothetical protein
MKLARVESGLICWSRATLTTVSFGSSMCSMNIACAVVSLFNVSLKSARSEKKQSSNILACCLCLPSQLSVNKYAELANQNAITNSTLFAPRPAIQKSVGFVMAFLNNKYVYYERKGRKGG